MQKYSRRERRFRLHGCPEDDTIFLIKIAYIFGCAHRSGAGNTGAAFYWIIIYNQNCCPPDDSFDVEIVLMVIYLMRKECCRNQNMDKFCILQRKNLFYFLWQFCPTPKRALAFYKMTTKACWRHLFAIDDTRKDFLSYNWHRSKIFCCQTDIYHHNNSLISRLFSCLLKLRL